MKCKKKRNQMRKFATGLLWLAAFPAIVFGLTFITLLVVTGRLRIKHKEHIPHHIRGLLILSNHPSYWDAYLLPFLFGWRSVWVSLFPWSTPDQGNFSHWTWFFASPRFIFVPRRKRRKRDGTVVDGAARALAKVRAVLLRKGRVCIFPEGGRTMSGDDGFAFDTNGRKMRRLKNGAARIIFKTKVPVLFVWFDGSDEVCPGRYPRWIDLLTKRTTLTIGQTINPPRYSMRGRGVRARAVRDINETLLTRNFQRLAESLPAKAVKIPKLKGKLV